MTLNGPFIRTMLPAWGLALVVAVSGPLQASPTPPLLAGPPERVFDWQIARCARWDIPDAPARAWRGPDGQVRLVAGSEHSRAAVGPDLDRLTRDCAILHEGSEDGDPAAYDDRSWFASVFSTGGPRVEALAHMEYHGHLRPERCAVERYAPCWRNAIMQLISEDGGRSFSQGGLVAALPYRYDGAAKTRQGYFNPSNILRDGDYLYAFVFAEATGAQKRGACLLRRSLDGDARDWRAWNGAGFTRTFVDPYRTDVMDPGAHVCEPVVGISSTISSVVRHIPSGLYLAVTPTTRSTADGAAETGIYWSASPNLINWSEPELLMEAPLLWRRDCAAPFAFAYPSLLDGASASPSFDTVGDRFWLYLVEMRLDKDCKIGPERNLIRLPVTWRAQ